MPDMENDHSIPDGIFSGNQSRMDLSQDMVSIHLGKMECEKKDALFLYSARQIFSCIQVFNFRSHSWFTTLPSFCLQIESRLCSNLLHLTSGGLQPQAAGSVPHIDEPVRQSA